MKSYRYKKGSDGDDGKKSNLQSIVTEQTTAPKKRLFGGLKTKTTKVLSTDLIDKGLYSRSNPPKPVPYATIEKQTKTNKSGDVVKSKVTTSRVGVKSKEIKITNRKGITKVKFKRNNS